jgi:ribose transport system permease protein
MGYTGQAYLTMGDPYLFASAAAVAVGGASILGGNGHYIGTVAGAFVLTLLNALLILFNLGVGYLDIAYGSYSLRPPTSPLRGSPGGDGLVRGRRGIVDLRVHDVPGAGRPYLPWDGEADRGRYAQA